MLIVCSTCGHVFGEWPNKDWADKSFETLRKVYGWKKHTSEYWSCTRKLDGRTRFLNWNFQEINEGDAEKLEVFGC